MKVSRKAAEREARRQELLKNEQSGDAAKAQPPAEAPAFAAQEADIAERQEAVAARNDESEADAVSRRSVGAGVDRMLGMARTGVMGELSETKQKLQVAQQAVASMDAELGELRPLKGADLVIGVDPGTVRPTGFFNRIDRSFSEKDRDFSELLEDVRRKGGNLVPGLIYKLPEPDGVFVYEAVYGHRRLAACLRAGVEFRAELAPAGMTPEQVMALQVAENAFRKKMSPIEQGKKIASMVDKLVEPSAKRLPDGTLRLLNGILKFKDEKYVGRLHTVGRTPDEVWAAFPDIRLVPFKAALSVARAYEADPAGIKARLTSVPSGLNAKQIAAYLCDTDQPPSPPSSSSPASTLKLHVNVPEASRAAFETELGALLKKYGGERA